MAKISIIGSGFSGLSAACYAAQAGHEVEVFEKNETLGGRARSFSENGFMFDMGPSWYWMPDIFEKFFADFGKTPSDYYELVKLSPSFQLFYKDHAPMVVPSELNDLYALFEGIEPGSADKLRKFLKEGELKYTIAMDRLIYKPALSWKEYASWDVLTGALRTRIFQSMSTHVRSYFKDERLISLMEFPVIFLGAMPDKIPALYSLMNYSAFSMGTWYPMGGMCKIIEGMHKLALSLGVKFKTNAAVDEIAVLSNKAISVSSKSYAYKADAVVASADYHHVEKKLLGESDRNYTEDYWSKKVMAPSCLIFYLGVNKRINKLEHHNLFFDTDFNKHASQIYDKPQWPEDPLFYACCPTKTDSSVAPAGMENLFILIPLASGLEDNKELHDVYFNKVVQRLEKHCNENISEHLVYKRSYCSNDFIADYNAFKGNAYGLANTLNQTAIFKPSIKNKHIENLFYTGQLTVPGPGVPPAIISGKIVVNEVLNYLKSKK
ncbi:phytoene dehydrogenase [Sphingobacteriaceae bacterium]|nr:phytoene dehydrogenase [Sphingobacteriaceae bacterium]